MVGAVVAVEVVDVEVVDVEVVDVEVVEVVDNEVVETDVVTYPSFAAFVENIPISETWFGVLQFGVLQYSAHSDPDKGVPIGM